MKKNLQLIALTFVATFLFTNLSFAQLVLQKLDSAAPAPVEKSDDGDWWNYDTGVSTGKVGLGGDGGVVWIGAIKFPAEDLDGYHGYKITKVKAYLADLPDAAAVIIFKGEAGSLEQIYYQMFGPLTEESWHELELTDPVAIDASEDLWIGIWLEEAGDGVFPLGTDNNAEVDGLGNLASWDVDEWETWHMLSAFGIAGVWNIQAFVIPGDVTVETFDVTFNVDMTDVDGFDPAVHDVYIAGSFPGDLEWNEPGSNDDLKLTLVGPAKDGEVVVILEEGFEGAGFPPDGWNNVDGNEDGNAWFRYTADDSANSGDASAASASWFDGTVLFPDNWLITPQLAIPNDTYMLEYYVGAQDPAWAEETYGIYISTTGADPDDFGDEIFGETMEDGDWHFREVSLADYAGEEIYIAFRHYNSSDWFYIKIDDVMVYGVAGDEPPVEDYIYTITLDLEEGDVQYKYFSTVIADGWAGGEWEGDPNRVITVDADMTVDDVFGDQPVSVVENELAEQGINLFPNPVRNTLYVENSELINDLRIFDLTGRLILSQVVNDNATSVNVSMFNTGVYIMQVMTVNGVVSKRFSVQ